MIVVTYDMNSAGVKFKSSTDDFILRDGDASVQCAELRDLMCRGGNVGNEIHIPETPTTKKLLCKIREDLL